MRWRSVGLLVGLFAALVACSAEIPPSPTPSLQPLATPNEAQYRQAHDRCHFSMATVLRDRPKSRLPQFGDFIAETDNHVITLTYPTISPEIRCTFDIAEDRQLEFCWAGNC